MISYDEAITTVLQTVSPLPPSEVDLGGALGRVLAEEAVSTRNMPPADVSAMDGYAFAHSGAKPGQPLKVVGFVPAGRIHSCGVDSGQAVKIMTGAALPDGCDTVIPFEDALTENGTVRLAVPIDRGAHVRRAGEEFRGGEVLLSPGTPIRSGEVGLLASAGVEKVSAHPRPRMALLSTGDELAELGVACGSGKIINSNAHLLMARAREAECEPNYLGIAGDCRETLAESLKIGLGADVLVTTGGVSEGDRDLVQDVLADLGFERRFWKVAIKPGKPVLFGTINGQAVFGLPGNPAAAGATFDLFVRPALRRLAGYPDPLSPRIRAKLEGDVRYSGPRQGFLWGRVEIRDGLFYFHPCWAQGSGQNRSLQGAHALLPVPPGNRELQKGCNVEILLLRMPPGVPKGQFS